MESSKNEFEEKISVKTTINPEKSKNELSFTNENMSEKEIPSSIMAEDGSIDRLVPRRKLTYLRKTTENS